MTWRVSSHSGASNCVEVGGWRVSSRSAGNGECVEVGSGAAVVAVRDTKNREAGLMLTFSTSAWETFLGQLKAA